MERERERRANSTSFFSSLSIWLFYSSSGLRLGDTLSPFTRWKRRLLVSSGLIDIVLGPLLPPLPPSPFPLSSLGGLSSFSQWGNLDFSKRCLRCWKDGCEKIVFLSLPLSLSVSLSPFFRLLIVPVNDTFRIRVLRLGRVISCFYDFIKGEGSRAEV